MVHLVDVSHAVSAEEKRRLPVAVNGLGAKLSIRVVSADVDVKLKHFKTRHASNGFSGLTNNDVGDVLVAYPAAVFMTVGHISNARAMLHQTGASIIISAAEHPAPILRSWRRKADGSAEMIWPEYKDTRSQDLEPTFYDAGQFYWWSSEVRIHLHANEEPQQRLYQLMPAETQDIDTEQDWLDAENKWAALFEDVP